MSEIPVNLRVAGASSYESGIRPRPAVITCTRIAGVVVGVVLLWWALFDDGFRNPEGALTGLVCLPLAVGIGVIIVGSLLWTRWLKASIWFGIAVVGQAATFQLVNAGWQLRYQHYKPFSEIVNGEVERLVLVFLAIQAILVGIYLWRRVPAGYRWLRENLGPWRVVILLGFLVLPAAAVSPNASAYLSELVLAVGIQLLNIASIVSLAISLPSSLPLWLIRLLQKFRDIGPADPSSNDLLLKRLSFLLAIAVIVLAYLLCVLSYERHPHVPDEVAYLVQAEFYANGILTMPAPPVPEGFDVYLMRVANGRWYPVPPPGWPLVLAFGAFIGTPWLINPLLAGLNLVLAAALFREIFPRDVSLMTIVLLACSPWYIFLGMSLMTHMLSLTCMLTGALGVVRCRKRGTSGWALLAGAAVGMLSLVRPLEAVGIGALIGLWAVGIGGKRLQLKSLALFGVGTILLGGAGLVYNDHLTGNPLLLPISEYTDEYFGKNSNAYGFGSDRGMGWAMDPYPGHGPVDAIINSNLNSSAINTELFGWGIGSLLFVGLGLCIGRLRKADFYMLAVIFVIYGLHFFYYFSGGPDFGGRYWFLMIVPLVVLAARGAKHLAARVDEQCIGGGHRVFLALFAMCLISLLVFVPWRAIDKYHNFRGMRPDIRYLASTYGFGRSLVLIQGNKHPDYDSAMVYNPLDLKADVPIYAWDRDAEVRKRLLSVYADRPVWIVWSPSLTGSGYQTVAGPMSAAELAKRDEEFEPALIR